MKQKKSMIMVKYPYTTTQYHSICFFNLHCNIMLWTKAKVGVDPERAFQAESGYFKQGIERYNVEPWVIPIGFKLNLTF